MTDRYSLNTATRLPFYFRDTDTSDVWQNLADAMDLEFTEWNTVLDLIEQARDVDTTPEEELRHKIANLGGDIPSYFPSATKALWTRQLIQFFKAKQSHENIEEAIRTVLGISVNIRAPWSAEPNYTVGFSEIGIDSIIQVGTAYKPADPDAYVVGTATVDSALVGEHGINIFVPRTVYVIFQIIPTDDQLKAVRYLVRLLKPAEEHCVFVTPELGQCWELSVSTLFLDTVLCAGPGEEECYTVDVSRVTLSMTVCGLTPAIGSLVTLGSQSLPDEGDSPTEDFAEPCFASLLPDEGSNPPHFGVFTCTRPNPIVYNILNGTGGMTVNTVGNIIGGL